jgi:tetratricopeptide (TPR) repeat protein
MSPGNHRIQVMLATIALAAVVALAGPFIRHRTVSSPEAVTIAPVLGLPGAPVTSAEGLNRRALEMEQRWRERPHDTGAAVLLADALLRQFRVTSNMRLAGRAGEVLEAVLKDSPAHYDATRMLGVVYLSQHRFREALEVARRARDLRPGDAWNNGIIGDAHLELGDYEQAFDAFDAMVTMRPSAAAYARVAYARELQGNVTGALEAMQLALDATTAHDPEAQAWYGAQIGDLYLKMGKLEEAEREYCRSAELFPNHPLVMTGLGKLRIAQGDPGGALAIFLDQLSRTPTLDLAARIADLHADRGDASEAERYYQIAEDLAGPSIAQTDAELPRFLAKRNRNLQQAVEIAEAVAEQRHDIFTQDALAWAYYKVGRYEEATAVAQQALRTGTRDPGILSHAAEIRRAADETRAGASRPHATGH